MNSSVNMVDDNEVNGMAKEVSMNDAETAEEESEEEEGYAYYFFILKIKRESSF